MWKREKGVGANVSVPLDVPAESNGADRGPEQYGIGASWTCDDGVDVRRSLADATGRYAYYRDIHGCPSVGMSFVSR
jgi:hypothetical protein